jgi:hypothetical protein
MATLRPIMNLRFSRTTDGDPNRCAVEAELAGQGPTGPITASVNAAIWVGDNPNWEQIQRRVLQEVCRAFSLPDELPPQTDSASSSDQKT